MADDQVNRGGQFVTAGKGQVPPLTTTEFTVLDQGNVSPRLMRSSVYNVPVSPDMLKQVSTSGGWMLEGVVCALLVAKFLCAVCHA